MNNIFKQNSLNAIVFKLQLINPTEKPQSSYCSAMPWNTGAISLCYNWPKSNWRTYLNKMLYIQYFSSCNCFSQQWEPESSYYSAMPWATNLQFYNVIASSKVDE